MIADAAIVGTVVVMAIIVAVTRGGRPIGRRGRSSKLDGYSVRDIESWGSE